MKWNGLEVYKVRDVPKEEVKVDVKGGVKVVKKVPVLKVMRKGFKKMIKALGKGVEGLQDAVDAHPQWSSGVGDSKKGDDRLSSGIDFDGAADFVRGR